MRFERAQASAWIALLCIGLVGVACVGPSGGGRWGRSASFQGFDPQTLNPGGTADYTILLPLSQLFYGRVTARRFDSLATFEDPALRELFHSEEAFADYYAAFAVALTRANFESNRPTAVYLESMARTGPTRVRVRVRFRGENALPLRWWSTRTVREDLWEFEDGRWWITPGKV
jgi:hypothetical protein